MAGVCPLPLTPSSRDVSNNQLSGKLPSTFVSGDIRAGIFSAGQNYFTGAATVTAAGQAFCPSLQTVDFNTSGLQQTGFYGLPNPALLLNCVTYSATTACKARTPQQEVQRTRTACAAFCGASVLAGGPCGGNGVCVRDPARSFVPTCQCNPGFLPDVAFAKVDGVTVRYPTCSVNPTSECQVGLDPGCWSRHADWVMTGCNAEALSQEHTVAYKRGYSREKACSEGLLQRPYHRA